MIYPDDAFGAAVLEGVTVALNRLRWDRIHGKQLMRSKRSAAYAPPTRKQ